MQDQIKLDALQAGSNHPVCGLQDPDTLPDEPCEDTTGLTDAEANMVRLATCADRLMGQVQSIDDAVQQWWQAGNDTHEQKQCSGHITHMISDIIDQVDKLTDIDLCPPDAVKLSGELGVERKTMADTIIIPAMPNLWHMPNVMVTLNDLLGALAMWAVKQSPYLCPAKLDVALKQFADAWPTLTFADYTTASSSVLEKEIFRTIEACPAIVAWNSPKKGNPVFGACSRYDKPKPDYDFIDLHALAKNITHDIVLSAQVDQAQDRCSTESLAGELGVETALKEGGQ